MSDCGRILTSLEVALVVFVGEMRACRTMYDRDGEGQLVVSEGESMVDCTEQMLVRVLDESKIELVRLRVSNAWFASGPSV